MAALGSQPAPEHAVPPAGVGFGGVLGCRPPRIQLLLGLRCHGELLKRGHVLWD